MLSWNLDSDSLTAPDLSREFDFIYSTCVRLSGAPRVKANARAVQTLRAAYNFGVRDEQDGSDGMDGGRRHQSGERMRS